MLPLGRTGKMGGGCGLSIAETHVLAKGRQGQPLAGQHAQAQGPGLEKLAAGQGQAGLERTALYLGLMRF